MFTAKGFNLGYNYWDATLAKVELPTIDLEKITAWLKSPTGFLVLQGNPGTGKTYLCSAILNDKWAKTQNVRFYRIHEFFNLLRKAIDVGSYDWELEKLSDCKHFILDDLGVTQHTEWQKEVINTLIDERFANGGVKSTIITTNLSENEIKEIYGRRFHSRLFATSNLVINFNGDDRRLRKLAESSLESTKKSLIN